MELIKERTNKVGIIRTRVYTSTKAYFDRLCSAAMADFPSLTPEEITIVHFGGRHYKGTFGIEFQLPEG